MEEKEKKMGTQQVLLIVLSVIIVGIAVAVGISMFNTQAQNANRTAVLGDLQNFGSAAMGFFKTPKAMGGGGNGIPGFGTTIELARTTAGRYIGFDAAGTLTNDNGTYTLEFTSAILITIVGLGQETGQDGANPVEATLTINTANKEPLSTVIDN